MLRDERRAKLKESLKLYERGGFFPGRIDTVFGFVRDQVDILTDAANPNRVSDSGALALKAYDECARRYTKPREAACRKGCSYCCHTRVTVTAPEIFVLARSLRKDWSNPDNPRFAAFRAGEAVTRGGLSDTNSPAGRKACLFLVDNACSVYTARPLPCRAYASLSLPACIDVYNRVATTVPPPELPQTIRGILFAGLKAALGIAGLDDAGYELGHAMLIALERGAEARWLAGEPLFADVAKEIRLPERRPGHDAFDLMVRVLQAGAYGKDVPENPWFQWAQ
jgi:hypothetical protein